MEDIKFKGNRVHIAMKVPQMYGNVLKYSYQFSIYNKNGEIQNYPFSRIVAKTDAEFKSTLKKNFNKFLNSGVMEAYPISKLIKNLSENLA
ncbi:MAG: hypothetical protein ACXAC5_23135 [Promethearchaeota archaeon]